MICVFLEICSLPKEMYINRVNKLYLLLKNYVILSILLINEYCPQVCFILIYIPLLNHKDLINVK